ncbi:MAG: hypothetical protein EOP53_07255 [Sphingobacteriales bacterium]|nr:MAG: hypothetical protein EOP53_07255 [Sphingobacteriales bacterium]
MKKTKTKKLLSTGKLLLYLLIASLISFSGCKKIKQGVIEIRRVLLTDITNPMNNTYSCFLAEEDATLKSGEMYEPPVAEYYHVRNSNYKEYHVYHENESAKSLGYTERQDGVNNTVGKDYYSNKNGSTTPGENGYWGGSKNPTGNAGGGGGTGEKIEMYNEVLSGDKNESVYFKFNMPPNVKHVEIRTQETPGKATRNSANLYVKKYVKPRVTQTQSYDLEHDADYVSQSNNREQDAVNVNNPPSGEWHVLLFNYESFFESNLIITFTM